MTIGIYKLNFIGTDKVYIGQSRLVERRLQQHLLLLRAGTHSRKMQAGYEKYGEPSLDLLCECNIEELNSFELETIEIYNSVECGFNSTYIVGEYSPSPGELNGQSVYTNIQILEVFNYLVDFPNLSAEEIHNITKVSVHVIYDISRGSKHTWISKEYPERYTQLLSIKGNRNSAGNRGILYPSILDPEGNAHVITNLSKFAREHNLQASNLYNVLKGNRKSHKGWKLKE